MANKTPRRPPAPEPSDAFVDQNSFYAELAHAGDPSDWPARMERIRRVLETVITDELDLALIEVSGRAAKKNYAQLLSTAIAQKTADALRLHLPGIKPDAEGRGHESKSGGASGPRKVDVNLSTAQRGLELLISIKTTNFRDRGSGRYTKNFTRWDKELNAEAGLHRVHPYAVLVVYVYLPADAATDGVVSGSSLRHAANILQERAGRTSATDEWNKFELAFLGLYETDGRCRFYKPEDIPRKGEPSNSMTFVQTLDIVRAEHRRRHKL